MSKRFVDTDLWQKEWFQELSLKEKVLVKYLFENCDCAGMWNANFRMATFIIGEKITIEDIKNINAKKEIFEILENGDVYVKDFIKFQYGTLSKNCKPHKPIIEKLKEYKKYLENLEGFPKGFQTLEEKEKEKEKDKEKEKEEEKESKVVKIENFKNPDLYVDPKVDKVFKTYENKCKNCIPLGKARRDTDRRAEIKAFLEVIENDFDYLEELCEKANELKTIYGNPIDIKALVKNYERIYSGFYLQRGEPEKELTNEELIAKVMREREEAKNG